MEETIFQHFRTLLESSPDYIIRSPGRVNLIGEHTDYNDGFVLPMAIDRSIWMAIRCRDDRKIMLHSAGFEDQLDFSLEDLKHNAGWGKYVSGVAWALQQAGYETTGWEGALQSDIPIGAGLSSSAALEMAVAKAFSICSGWTFEPLKIARIGQRAENEWVGANTGIMDQTIVASGQAGHALMIDCRDLTTRQVPLPDHVSVVILDSATRHTHTDSGYNERREQCETAARFFGVSHLRDVTLEQFNSTSVDLNDLPRRRARHIITENERVLQAVKALSAGNVAGMGKLMDQSHESMRDDFEITNHQIDIMAALAQSEKGCLGARMTGGGFGGCVIALVENHAVPAFTENMQQEYEDATGLQPRIYICQASNGVEAVWGE